MEIIMGPELLHTLSALIAVIGFAAAVIARRRSTELQALLINASNRYEQLKSTNTRNEQGLKDQKDNKEKNKKKILKFEKALTEARAQLAAQENTAAEEKESLEIKLKRVQLNNDHLKEETTALVNQLKEAQSNKKQAISDQKENTQQAITETQKQLSQTEEELKKAIAKVKELYRTNKKLKHNEENLKKILRKVDPTENRKNKNRAEKMEQLYTTMKGLRDMSEERNLNWELALRKLSSHILQIPDQPKDAKIGELVGKALEFIGTEILTEKEESQLEESIKNLDIEESTEEPNNPVQELSGNMEDTVIFKSQNEQSASESSKQV